MTLPTNSSAPLSESIGSNSGAGRQGSSRESLGAESADRVESTIVKFPRRRPVALATLTRSGILLDGEEAIAIGQALCITLATMLGGRRPDTSAKVESEQPAITTETVFIDPASRLGVSATDPGEEAAAIESVARILSEITPSETLQVLAPILAKALASPPQFATLAELSQALAAFEQPQGKDLIPQGRELIQAVYGRWCEVELTAALRSPTAVPDPRPTSRIRFGSQPRAIAAAAAIVVAVLLAGLGATFLMSRSAADGSVGIGDAGNGAESPPLLESWPIAVAAPLMTPSAVLERRPTLRVTAGPVDRAELPVRAARSGPVATSERIAAATPRQSGVGAKSSAVQAAAAPRIDDVAPSPQQVGENGVQQSTSVSRNSDGVRGITSPNSRLATEPIENTPAGSIATRKRLPPPMIYSARDADVVPPRPILPRLLASLHPSSPGIRLDALAIAVVVDEQGRAYSVNGVNAPENMGEYVLLTSALAVVKSWEFEPASKDGTPVRYRLIVPLRRVTGSQQ